MKGYEKMGKKKHKKDGLGENTVHLLLGITDIYYNVNEENHEARLGFGDVQLLGIYKKNKDVFTAIDLYNEKDDVSLKSWDYLMIEELTCSNIPSIECQYIESRTTLKFVESEDKYIPISSIKSTEKLWRAVDEITSTDEGADYIYTTVLNLANTEFIVTNNTVEFKPLNEDDFEHVVEPDEVPFENDDSDETEFKEEITDEDVKKELKEFVANPDNDLTINNRSIKSSEDVDNLSDEEVGFIKENFMNQIEADDIDEFFLR